MRICHVIESSSGGSSHVVVDLMRDQLAVGHDVTLIYSPLRAESPFTDAVAALGPKLRVRALPMRRAVGLHDVGAAFRLWRALSELGPFDVIHGHSSKGGALSRIAGALLPGKTAIVYTPHAFVTLSPEASRLYGLIEWLASWHCDAIIVGSSQEFQHARDRLRLPASRLRLIPMGVDLGASLDRAAIRAQFNLAPTDFAVGFVGRMAPQKNPLKLAAAFGAAAHRRPDLRFVVVGDGELFETFRQELQTRRIADRTLLAPGAEGRVAIAAFDCLVCTSDYESFGLIFAEALAAGVPIVSPPVGIAEDAIVEGETGFLTGFGVEDIAAGILRVAERNADARAKMAAACVAQSIKFDMAETAARTRALYDELISRRARRPS